VKPYRATGIMAVIVLLAFAFAVVGCAGRREQAPSGAAGGGDPAQPAQEAKASRTDAAAIPPLPAEGSEENVWPRGNGSLRFLTLGGLPDTLGARCGFGCSRYLVSPVNRSFPTRRFATFKNHKPA
jgi:hypothetical protein